jgi:hypothetical protein
MSGVSDVSSNPTGALRPRSHQLATKPARGGSGMPRGHCDDLSARPEGFERCLMLPNGSILATELALSGDSRLRSRQMGIAVEMTGVP